MAKWLLAPLIFLNQGKENKNQINGPSLHPHNPKQIISYIFAGGI
jgi:hypothetical protein